MKDILLLKKTIRFAIIAFAIFLFFFIQVYRHTIHNYTAAKMLYSFIFACTSSGIINYIFTDYDKKRYKNWFDAYKWEIGFVATITLILLPILTQSYLFYDDYWSFASVKTAQFGISLGRPLNSLMGFALPPINAGNVYIVRWVAVVGLIAFGLCFFRWLKNKCENPLLSFIITMCICLLSPIIDAVGYGSTFPFSWGIAFSGFSVIAAEKAWNSWREKKLKSILLYTLAFISLLGAFNLYQLATPIIFLFLLIKLYYHREKNKRYRFLLGYGLLFCVTIIFYMMSTNFLSAYYGEMVSSRGSIINSWNDVTLKLDYFKDVLIKSTDQVAISFLGNLAFSNCGRINVLLSYWDPNLQMIICSIIWIISVISLVKFAIKTKRFLDVLFILLFIPLSYYCLLILKESSYVSYYVFPLTATIMFLFINGLKNIIEGIIFVIRKICHSDDRFNFCHLLVPFVLLMMLQANLYVSNFWVGYNKNGYNYVKNSIYSHLDDSNWIHIYGVLYSGQGNIYSVFTAQRALEELKVNPDEYKITTSDNSYYISIIQLNDYNLIKEKLSFEDAAFLDSMYIKDDIYNRYYISRYNLTEDELTRLQHCFNVSEMIPLDKDKTIIIDLSWVGKT